MHTEIKWDLFQVSPKQQRELEQCIVSAGEGGETVNESECAIDGETDSIF